MTFWHHALITNYRIFIYLKSWVFIVTQVILSSLPLKLFKDDKSYHSGQFADLFNESRRLKFGSNLNLMWFDCFIAKRQKEDSSTLGEVNYFMFTYV